jgi:hypothetical protein
MWTAIFVFVILILLVATGILVWYIRRLISALWYFKNNIKVLLVHLGEYKAHLDIFLGMEAYSGEPVVQNLQLHSKDIVGLVEEFGKVFDDFTPNSEELEEKEEIEEPPVAEDQE